jgi:hypothetical protein
MERVLIFVLASALVGLFFSRLHFHFSFNLSISRRGATELIHASSSRAKIRRGKPTAGEISGEVTPAVRSIRQADDVSKRLQVAKDKAESDIFSALLNLGCEKGKAQNIARSAMGEGKDFTSRLTWAVQHAA